MTTTDVFQGMSSEAKPSSRVIRPPGGGSSNIFGTNDADDKPQQRRQQPATSNLFGAEDESKDKVGKRQGGPPDNSRANVFGGSMVQDNTAKDNKRRGQVSTYNPITGEDTPGHMAEEPLRRRGKRGHQTSSVSDEGVPQGMYNPITGQPYSAEEDGKKEEGGRREEEEEQKQQQQQQQQAVRRKLFIIHQMKFHYVVTILAKQLFQISLEERAVRPYQYIHQPEFLIPQEASLLGPCGNDGES
ncbi:hypothetical protein FSP39_007658 [Pinctada imbricata]|uniref:Microtubule-associated protein Jupiter n=1 Tax=Pinctada imbricata TaxID=66713 RepID=A0AA88Y838_PINIB|nr:hypothetical protein FSP39_007658 [Pinctada imbricata]